MKLELRHKRRSAENADALVERLEAAGFAYLQHDYDLANQAGAAFRADANNALSAILSLNSGSSAPSTTVAGMLWYDTSNAVVKQRNAANSAWITRWTVANAEGVFTALVDISGASAGQIKFPATQNASANANTLDDYDEYTAASAACTGAITPSVVWKLTKVGNLVTLTLPVTNGTATATPSFSFGTAIPAKYRPSADIHFACPMKNNGAYQAAAGSIFVASATGVISCYRLTDFTSNFTNGANAGTDYAMSVSWTI